MRHELLQEALRRLTPSQPRREDGCATNAVVRCAPRPLASTTSHAAASTARLGVQLTVALVGLTAGVGHVESWSI